MLLKNPNAIRLGGEKKELTVFFSDLAGFTDLSEELASPESLAKLVNWYLAEMTDFVIDNGGFRRQHITRHLTGVFCRPEPPPHPPLAACPPAPAARRPPLEM